MDHPRLHLEKFAEYTTQSVGKLATHLQHKVQCPITYCFDGILQNGQHAWSYYFTHALFTVAMTQRQSVHTLTTAFSFTA
jgi:hypothetical protein